MEKQAARAAGFRRYSVKRPQRHHAAGCARRDSRAAQTTKETTAVGVPGKTACVRRGGGRKDRVCEARRRKERPRV
eukprot:3365043-Prymnesium_polylepis.2